MTTILQRTAGRSLAPTSDPLSPAAVEAAVLELLAPYGRAATWLEVSKRRFYRNGQAGDPSAQFRIINRAGGNKFGQHPLEARHAFVTDCAVTGLPIMCFGAGGAGNNPLTETAAGTLTPVPEQDGLGVEIGNPDVFLPNQGVTVAAKFQIPAASALLNGVQFGATVGGPIVASQAATAASSFSLEVATSIGRLRTFSRAGNGAGQYMEGWDEIRTGAVFEVVRTYAPGLSRYSGWWRVHGGGAPAVQPPVDAGTTDIAVTAGCSKLLVGGRGTDGSGVQIGFVGFLSCVIVAPDAAVGTDATSRAKLFALLAQR